MASLDRVKARIQKLAGGSRTNLMLSDIAWVVEHLGRNGYRIAERDFAHGKLFTVNSRRFHVCCHNPGNSQIKRCYVDEFVEAMIELGLYED